MKKGAGPAPNQKQLRTHVYIKEINKNSEDYIKKIIFPFKLSNGRGKQRTLTFL